MMTPARIYRSLNKFLWLNRLPKAAIKVVANDVMPRCHGITFHDDIYVVKPVILLNASTAQWTKTLVHEMVHVAEPQLPHGKLFTALVETYWRLAQIHLKDTATK